MNQPFAGSQSEPPAGSPILGPAVPPREEQAPRRGVIDWEGGPFSGGERTGEIESGASPTEGSAEAASSGRPEEVQGPTGDDLPWLTDRPAQAHRREADEGGAGSSDAGAGIIESGVLGGGEMVPIESIMPDTGAAPPVHAEDAVQRPTDEPWSREAMAPEVDTPEVESPEAEDWFLSRGEPYGASPSAEATPAEESEPRQVASSAEQPEPAFGTAERGVEEEMSEPWTAPDTRDEPEPAFGTGVFAEPAAEAGASELEEPPVPEEDPYWEPWSEPAAEDAAPAETEEVEAGGAEPASEAPALPLTGLEIPGASSALLREIAERLERIARSLRTREGDELGGDASDPLEVLITGYVLGFSEGARSSGSAPGEEE